jgi:hypothetical protein
MEFACANIFKEAEEVPGLVVLPAACTWMVFPRIMASAKITTVIRSAALFIVFSFVIAMICKAASLI